MYNVAHTVEAVYRNGFFDGVKISLNFRYTNFEGVFSTGFGKLMIFRKLFCKFHYEPWQRCRSCMYYRGMTGRNDGMCVRDPETLKKLGRWPRQHGDNWPCRHYIDAAEAGAILYERAKPSQQ